MRVPISWLKEYIRFSLDADKLAEVLLLSGTKVEKVLKNKDEIILDLEITPNRPDTLSMIGVAREVSAVTKKELIEPNIKELPKNFKSLPVDLKIQEKKLCPNYSLVAISEIKVGKSPSWIKERLENAGIRSINNVVDITNYVMLEMGQPMHAFDYNKIKGGLTLRSAKKSERVITLDTVARTLPEGAIIIEDEEKLVDLAGLMGGANSEVDESTSTILLHVPVYDPVVIRKTSLVLGLRTEASGRFEKNLDLSIHETALKRASNLILETAGGEIASEVISVNLKTEERITLELNIEKVREFLGIDIGLGEVSNILTSLGFQIKTRAGEFDVLEVTAPNWRRDIGIVEDLYEEIGRIYGYNNIPGILPVGEVPVAEESSLINLEFRIKDILKSLGFTECYLSTLTSKKIMDASLVNEEDALKISNPMSVEFEYLRRHLLGGLLVAAELNLREYQEISLFELGRVFKTEIKNGIPLQPKKLTLVTTKSFFELKGVLESLFTELGIDSLKLIEGDFTVLTSGTAAEVLVKETKVGKIGSVEKRVLDAFGIKKPVSMLNLKFETLAKFATDEKVYKSLPKFPYVEEDFSLLVSKETKMEAILSSFKVDPKIERAEVFDTFSDKSMQDKKSIGVRVRYQAKDHTLSPEEISQLREKITSSLTSLKATLR